MNKNLVLIVTGTIVIVTVAAMSTLMGIGSLPIEVGLPMVSGVVTLVLGALLAILDPTPRPPTP